jgi:hypothetical protein
MAEDSKDISYNPALETLIATEAEKCTGLAWLHKRCEAKTSVRNDSITIPSIVLSTIVGFLSSTSTSLFSNPTTASIGIGAVSLFTGILSTVGNYYSFAKRTEGHRIASISYSKLARFLEIELSLPKSERILAKDLLKITKDQIERLLETSPAVDDAVIAEYKKLFKDITDVAHPAETNGLHKVTINSKEFTLPTPKSAVEVRVGVAPGTSSSKVGV